jgi:hypothetical protein
MHQQQLRANRQQSPLSTGARLRQLLTRGSTSTANSGIASVVEARTEQGRALHRHIADNSLAACEATIAAASSNGSLGALLREIDEFGVTPLGSAINHSVTLRNNRAISSGAQQRSASDCDAVALALLAAPDAEQYINLQDK